MTEEKWVKEFATKTGELFLSEKALEKIKNQPGVCKSWRVGQAIDSLQEEVLELEEKLQNWKNATGSSSPHNFKIKNGKGCWATISLADRKCALQG